MERDWRLKTDFLISGAGKLGKEEMFLVLGYWAVLKKKNGPNELGPFHAVK